MQRMEVDDNREFADFDASRKPCCKTVHCRPNGRTLFSYNNLGDSPIKRTTFHDGSAAKWPVSTSNRFIIGLKEEGLAIPDGPWSQVPKALNDSGITQDIWNQWIKRFNDEVDAMVPRVNQGFQVCLAISGIGLPCFFYYHCRTQSAKKRTRTAFMASFNREVLEPRNMYAKLCCSQHVTGSGDHNKLHEVEWITIALTPQHVKALKQESDKLRCNTKNNTHDEVADGSCCCCCYCY